MAIENINDYAGMWANGVNIGQLWDKIKEKFVSGAHDQSDATTYPASWKQQARANIGLTISANAMWYGSAANTIGEVTTSTFGRGLLNTSSGTEITGLFAETAEKDKNGIEISENYANSLAISDGYLRLKNNRYVSGTASAQDLSALQLNVKLGLLQLDNTGSAGKIPLVHIPDAILGQLTYGGNIASYQSTGNKLVVNVTTGAKAILEQRTGRTISGTTINLVNSTSARTGVDFNYEDCKGIYFIWTDNALEDHTGEEARYRQWPSNASGSTDPRYQSGDWLISVDTKWDKVDNTDAVTGVKGSGETTYRLNNVSIDALDVRALATYDTNTTQTVADKVQFNKDIWSLGGVAAYGISDLSAGGGGGGGLSGTIIRNWSNYQGAETEVLGANLGMRGFRMSGYSFQVNKPAVGADNWQTEFTLGTANIPDLPLTQITGTTELRKIETLAGTGTPSGFLKRASDGNWSFDTSSYLSLAGGTMDNTNVVTNLNADLLDGYEASSFYIKKNVRSDQDSIYDLRYNFGEYDKNDYSGTYASEYPSGYGVYLSLAYANRNNAAIMAFDCPVNNNLGRVYVATRGAGSGNTQYSSWGGLAYLTDNVASATKLQTARAISIASSDGTGAGAGVIFDGSAAVTLKMPSIIKADLIGNASTATQMDTETLQATQEFIYRACPKTKDVDSVRLDSIKGKTLVWNQLINALAVSGTSVSSVVMTNNKNGSFSFSGTSSGRAKFNVGRISAVNGHKYILLGGKDSTYHVNISYYNGNTYVSTPYDDTGRGVIFTLSNSNVTNMRPECIVASESGQSVSVTLWPMLIDLTLMFGSGYEPASVADFKAKYPAFLSYNVGELINNSAKAIESVGFNLWDGKYISGKVLKSATGLYADDDASFVTDYIPVIAGATYYCSGSFALNSQSSGYCFYDINKNYISGISSSAALGTGTTLTIPSGAAYLRATGNLPYISTACINISDTSKNGTYEPYKRVVTTLNLHDIHVKSPNIWDEVWEVGGINYYDGSKNDSLLTIRSKNYIKVTPNSSIYITSPANSVMIYAYDDNLNYIGAYQNGNFITNGAGWASNVVITLLNNICYIKFASGSSYGTTYNNDICINKSDIAFNGRYFPHGELTFNGLKSAGDVYDEITNGGRTLIRRVGNVNLGSLTWAYESGNQRFTSNLLTPSVKILSPRTLANLLCARYSTLSSGGNVPAGQTGIIYNGGGNLCIHDTAYTDATTFTNAVSGVYTNYELANYETYELVEPIPTAMFSGTTERRLPEDTADSVIAPFVADMTYGTNAGDILASAIPFSRLQDVRIERGAFTMSTQNDSNWFLVTLGDKQLYLRFTVNTGAFKLEMASDNTDNPEYSKEFEFATLSTADINDICV